MVTSIKNLSLAITVFFFLPTFLLNKISNNT